MNLYKDRSPYDTVRAAKDYFLEQGIEITEIWGVNNAGLHSVVLEIAGTNINANGKGTSRITTLASAYGELIERLHNLAYFRFHTHWFHRDVTAYEHVVDLPASLYPDLIAGIEQYLPTPGALYDRTGLAQFSQARSGPDRQETLRCLTYRNNTTDDQLVVPVDILDTYYVSNGMAAGNSPDETWVQGLSEILERFVARSCKAQKLTPPKMDAHLLKSLSNYPDYIAHKKRIEASGRYRVELRDMSLGIGIPAIGLFIIDQYAALFIVNVGVHPVLEVALERCLTEIFQGKDMNRIHGMMGLNASSAPKKPNDIMRFLDLPDLFLPTVSWQPSLIKRTFSDNAAMKAYLLDLIEGMGYTLFYFCWSTQPLYVYHFFVPGMSEMVEPNLAAGRLRMTISHWTAQGLQNLSRSQAQTIVDGIESSGIDQSAPLDRLLHSPTFVAGHPYRDMRICLFKFRLHRLLEQHSEAVAAIKYYLHTVGPQGPEARYYACYQYYLELRLMGMDDQTIAKLLIKCYPATTANAILRDAHRQAFYDLPPLACAQGCDRCKCRTDCLTHSAHRLYERLTPHLNL